MLDAAPPGLRGRALALQGAGLMFTQGVGFGFWGIAGQFAPLVAVIPAAAAAGLLVVVTLRPRPPRQRLTQPRSGDAGAAWLSRRHLRRRWTDHQA